MGGVEMDNPKKLGGGWMNYFSLFFTEIWGRVKIFLEKNGGGAKFFWKKWGGE
jgi:hypothetical protein